MDGVFLFGRMIFGGYFLYNGLNHFLSHATLVQHTAAKGVPLPDIAVAVSGLLLLIGGLCILTGLWPHIGLVSIALFLLGVTPIMHNFWVVSGTERMPEMINFMKNMALLGGTLIMAGVPRPWPYSLEQRRRIPA